MKLKLLIIVPSLFIGGSENVIIHLVKHIDRQKFNITLLVLNASGELMNSIPHDISVVKFYHSRTLFSIFSVIKSIKRIKPNLVLSTLGHLNLIIALIKPILSSKIKFIARESSIVSIRNKDERYPKLFNFLFKTVYNRFDMIICQSQFMKNDLVFNFKIDSSKIDVINNPIDFQSIPNDIARIKSNQLSLLSVGNLRPEKGYDRLLQALKKVTLDYQYKIVGGGNVAGLKALIDKLSIEKRVVLCGSIRNPFPYYLEADCLLVGSYYEGFPNVILEANACGLPVIAFEAPGGHNEIIINGVNGWFVKNDEEFNKLLSEKAFERLNRDEIITLTKEKYDLKKIVKQYEKSLIGASL